MPQWICLLRGINVGGKNILPMKTLVSLLDGIGCTEVSTYIQSGNVVFQTEVRNEKELAELITCKVESKQKFRPGVMLLKPGKLNTIIQSNPFNEKDVLPKSIHCFFLGSKPKSPDFESMDALKSATEHYLLGKDAFYLYAPDGIARSKLAAKAEKLLGVEATARNWNTVLKLHSMVAAN